MSIGIEGEVIRYGLVVAVLMTLFTAVMTLLWAFPLSLLTLAIAAGIVVAVGLIGGTIYWVKRPTEVESSIVHQS
ncbi:MAG: hypothetical protein ACXACG_06040 [Candidatus Thorarchaeota archaeon]|jgi:uncharacterized membrane protein